MNQAQYQAMNQQSAMMRGVPSNVQIFANQANFNQSNYNIIESASLPDAANGMQPQALHQNAKVKKKDSKQTLQHHQMDQPNKYQTRQVSQDYAQHQPLMYANQNNMAQIQGQFPPQHNVQLQQRKQHQMPTGAIGGRKGSLPSSFNAQQQQPANYGNQNQQYGGQSQSHSQQFAKVQNTFKQSQLLNKNQPLINKGSAKLIKSHAKYFSQQNSPVSKEKYQLQSSGNGAPMQSGTGLIQIDGESQRPMHRDYGPSELITQASGGGLGGGLEQLSHQNTGNFVTVSHHTPAQSQGGADIANNRTNPMEQRRSNKNYAQLTQHSVNSKQSGSSHNGGRIAANYSQQQLAHGQAYVQQQQFQGTKPQKLSYLKNQKQIPSKYSNSGNVDNNHQLGGQGGSLGQPLGGPSAFSQGRLSVGGDPSSVNSRPFANQKGLVNSDQIPIQPSQSYIKQYHSINQGPIISSAAGNQTVATGGNSVGGNTAQTFQTHQTQNTHATLITNQTLQNSLNMNHKKLKQKYDEAFLNGPLVAGHIPGQLSSNGEIADDTIVHQLNQHFQDVNHNLSLQAALQQKRFSQNQSQLVGSSNPSYHQMMLMGASEAASLEQSPEKRASHKRIISNPAPVVGAHGGQQLPHQVQRANTSMGMPVSGYPAQNQHKNSAKNNVNMNKTDITFTNQGKQKSKAQKQPVFGKQMKSGSQVVGMKNMKRPGGGSQNQQARGQQRTRPGSNTKPLYDQPFIDVIQEQQELMQSSMQMSSLEMAGHQQQKAGFPHSQHTSLSRHPANPSQSVQLPSQNLQQSNQSKKKASQNPNSNMQQLTGANMRTKTPNQIKRPNPQTLIVPQSQIIQPSFKRSIQGHPQQQYQPQMSGNITSNSSGNLGIGLKNQQPIQSVYQQNGPGTIQHQGNLVPPSGFAPQKSQSQKGLVSYNHQQYQQHIPTAHQNTNANSLGTITPAVLPLTSQVLNKQQLQQISNLNSQTSQSIEELQPTSGMSSLVQQMANSPLKPPPKTIQQQQSKKMGQAGAKSQMGNYYQNDNQMSIQNASKKDALTFSMKKQNFRERTKADSMMLAEPSASVFPGGQNAGNAAYLNQLEMVNHTKYGGGSGHHRQLTSSGLANPKTNGSSLLALPRDPREPQMGNDGQNEAFANNHASVNFPTQLHGGNANPVTSKSQKSSTSRLINSSSWAGKHQANAPSGLHQINASAGSAERIKNMNQMQELIENIQGLQMQGANNMGNYVGMGPGGVGDPRALMKGAGTTSSKNSKASLSSKRAAGGAAQGVRGNKAGQVPSHSNKSNSATNHNPYPYQSQSTKSGGPSAAAGANAQKAQKQNAPNNNLSIAKIFQSKGLNYKGPSKVLNQGKTSKSSNKNLQNNTIINQRGVAAKVALTTSANTAQNSPRIMNNQNSMYNKNGATIQGGNTSARRKPSTSSMGGIVSSQKQAKSSYKQHQGQPNQNNEAMMVGDNPNSYRQHLDESNVQVTEVAYGNGPDSSEGLLHMRQLEPSKMTNYSNMMNQNSQDRLLQQKNQDHLIDRSQRSQKSSKPQLERQQQANNDKMNALIELQMKNSTGSLGKFQKNHPIHGLNNQAGSLQISSQYSNQQQLSNSHHQLLDGGTGANPNLINQQRPNQVPQNQNLNAHHQPNSLSLGQLGILDPQNSQMIDAKKIPSKYSKPQQNDQMQSNQQKIQKKGQNILKNFQKKEENTVNNRDSDADQFVFNEAIEYAHENLSGDDLPYGLPDGPLITEDEEQEIRQVAADINERAFYGKVLRAKQIMSSSGTANDGQLRKLSPRSQEIAFVMKHVDQAFKAKGEASETKLEFYRIGKMLGRGAFGKVNLAMHKLVRKLVALKSLNKECLTDEVQKQKLMKEVNLLLKLRHDHVVKIYETIETKKHIIIVMELCAGGDLLNYVRKRRRLKEPFAKKIFKQIIDGLGYIHSKFIAHRDIKLDNILLDGKGSVKIADFGVSKQCQPGVKMREQCGTPAYIAPEILKNKNGYSFNVDLWSAGVVLFAMLYGTVPFKAASMDELHSLILRGVYSLKDDISQEARDMLRGLLEINPHKRLTIEQILAHPWLQDYEDGLQLFNDQEREMIKKEYTYNDPSRYNRNENEEPVDCFTEHNIDSVYNTLKNCSEKSIILAPFNSTQSGDMEAFKQEIKPMMVEKNMALRLSRLCREIDRQYEFNNNGQLDNGVYHKQINNSADDKSQDSGDKGLGEKDEKLSKRKQSKRDKKEKDESGSDDADSESRFQVIQCSRSHGQEFLTEDYRDQKKENEHGFINGVLGNMTEAERQLIESTFGTNKEMDIDESKVEKLVQFGYPKPYCMQSLMDNQPNYMTAGYYLLQMDQNYC